MAAYGTMPAQRVLLKIYLLLLGLIYVTASTISDLRKCADKTCSVTLSRATAMARYPASSPLHLSLNKGDIIEIKSKSAGNKPDLWGGEVNGRRGYFPKAFVREFDVKIDNPMLDIPTEENVWAKQPPQQQQKQPPPVQQQSPPPVVPEAVKDETEIDETDVTDLDGGNAETIPKQDDPSQTEPSPTQEEKETSEEATKEEEVKEEEKAQMKDPLLHDIEELQRSLSMMGEVRQDAQALNNFIADKFASAPAKPDTEGEPAQPTEDPATHVSAETVPDVGKDVDETDIDGGGSVHAPGSENTVQPKIEDSKAQPPKEEKKEEESLYIPGVRVLEQEEDHEEEEEEEVKDVHREEKAAAEEAEDQPTESTQKIEDKPAETVQSGSGGPQETKAQPPTEIVEEVKEKPTEHVQPVETVVQPPAGDTSAQGEHKQETPPSTQDSIVDRDSQPAQQDVVKQTIPETVSQEAPAVAAADQIPASGDQVHVPDAGHVDAAAGETAGTGPVVGTGSVPVPDAASTGSGTEGAAAPKQEVVEEKLLFQPELGKPKQAAEAPEVKETKDSPVVMNTETLEALSKSQLQDAEAAKVKAAQEIDPLGLGAAAELGTPMEQQPDIHPDKTVTQPSGASSGTGHQPVDINFKAGQVQDSATQLEGSVSVAEQQLPTQTPSLEATPALEQSMTGTAAPVTPQDTQAGEAGMGEQNPTTVIDGTRFYLVDGEIADIVPESVSVQQATASVQVPPTKEPEMSVPPPEATQSESVIQPTPTPVLPEMSTPQASAQIPAAQGVNIPDPTPQTPQQVRNATEAAAGTDSPPDQPQLPKVNDGLGVGGEQYQTNADFLSRKMLSVNSQTAGQPVPQQEGSQAAPAQNEGIKQTSEQLSNTPVVEQPPAAPEAPSQPEIPASDTVAKPDTLASEIQPSASVDTGGSSVIIEGEEPASRAGGDINQNTGDQPQQGSAGDSSAESGTATTAENSAPASDEPVVSQVDASSPLLSTEGESIAAEVTPKSQTVQAQATESVTQPPDPLAWDGVPPPPVDEVTPPSTEQVNEEPTVEGDPYQMDDYNSRKINDGKLDKAEEEAAVYSSGNVRSLEARSKAFIDTLPPSIQSLLEQEPLGLSPVMTILVTLTTFVVFISMTCFSCVCSSGGKKAGTKDPLVVVRELEEKLLLAVKEKENMEDMLQERQSETKRQKAELSELKTKSGTVKSDHQNVTLHNEVLKTQVTSLQTEVAELKEQLAKKTDDVKVKDKKSKDGEKETKKLQEAKHKLEQNLYKKENELQRQGDENENLKTTIQSLTDQVQLLDTSKQQLLAEADDWKEKVDELKERLDQVEQENRQSQETISFKDNELEVMKDCYLQLKSLLKGGGDGEDEEAIDAASDEELQEKIKAMMDVSKVNATLRAVQEEKDNLGNKLKIENDARRELEEQLECARREMESSMADKMKAERQAQEAQTKLNVLSSYFKDKELQLQRELGEHEALKKQNLSKLDNADEYTRSMQKELELSKQQTESLKRELTASERDFRSQIAANEKKAHENWLNARAAERELKECKHEAAVLRQKLTDVERRHMEPGLIRPLPTRGMPPPGMMNGPPPPEMERSPSRGSIPPGAILPGGPPPPPFRQGEFPLTPRERERLPPSHPARHMPPPPHARSPPPHMMPHDPRGSPPRMLPPDARSPPPYDRRGPPGPPLPLGTRSPPMRLPHPDMVQMRGPFPPHMGHPPPMGSPGPRMDSPRDPRSPYGRQPPPGADGRRHQSQV
ncbi:hypothetical protein V1264_018253 [Littorina saxatilis]|uniref:SH3 domain-containing protein n=1 Tax=Littorina saxatilis TaxID=31220 RepID=A0AAN9BDR4_9CAEN